MKSHKKKKLNAPTVQKESALPPKNQGDELALSAVVACFVLSGFAALLYQTAWLRQFSLTFGTSEIAVATVLAAYMGGLALGATIAGRYASKVKRPVLVYGLLEIGIALSALTVPLLLLAARNLYVSVLGDQPVPPHGDTIGQPVFYLLTSFLVLALPTGLMGATLPLLTRHAVRTNKELGPRVSLLYAANTGGAVIGTLVAAFILLPRLGLNGTVWIGVAVNAAVFCIATLLATRSPRFTHELAKENSNSTVNFIGKCILPFFDTTLTHKNKLKKLFLSNRGWILPLILISGATSFIYEVLWTRMLSHVMGGSIYAFATMLAAFLTGITIGGALAGKMAGTRERAIIAFAFSQVLIALFSIAVYRWMVPLIPSNLTTHQIAIYAALVMLPATFFVGATLPLAIRVFAKDEKQAMTSTARIYSWNTVGAIIGAILAGFYLIPELGFEGTIRIAIVLNLGLALWALATIAKPKPVYLGLTAVLLIAVILVYKPSRPIAAISSTGFIPNYLSNPREIYYGVGRSSTVFMVEEDGYYYLRTNGLPEASISAKGSPPVQDPEKWLTALAVTARPSTENMLVIGFGGGVALEGIPTSVSQIDVIEIEPEVIAANSQLQGLRNIDPLEDSRFNIVINDARNALRLTSKTYDTIISQPSHPWTAGASHLFTQEFIAEAKTHLNDDGVFVQWMNSEFINEQLLRTLAATLVTEFANVRLYHPTAQVLIFLASDAPLDLESQLISSGQPFNSDIMHYSRLGMNSAEDLFAALAMDETGTRSFAHGSPLSTDNNNLMATHSNSRADGLLLPELIELFEPYDPLLQSDSWVHTQFGNIIDYGYLARRILQLGQYNRLERLAEKIINKSSQLELYGILYESNFEIDRARQAFLEAINANPRNMQARYNLVKDWLGIVGTEDAPEHIQIIAENIIGPARAVLEGWHYGQNQDWESLAKLDAELGRSSVTDAWYSAAVQLRAGWRTSVSVNTERYAYDALRLIERALVLDPNQRLHWLRMVSATRLGYDDHILESSRYIAASLGNGLAVSEEAGYAVPIQDLVMIRQNLVMIINRLRNGLEVRDEERISLLIKDVNELIESVDGYPLRD